ncbi:Glutaredoxin-like domain protein [Pyrobaculum islandicum DSM 4184]|uniref:Glutaredoxin-like domain protein n=1 Tax=Pyrobaculum islandicum (strain DSM 4184 / JCM 9189 / GEO3) TaxID=384616 RepID=A1RS60_PYRIL|nr:thioredoxin family protein [Pyrobaculum islandicum]ABL87792.1 Glutaredoxin-like domain protein [Pyrobaculum islandicum DSM 4184]
MATPIGGPEEEVPHIEVDEETREIIREMLSQMENPVEINFFTSQNCAGRETNWCIPTEEFLDLLIQLAPQEKLRLNKYLYEKDAESFKKFGVEPQRVPVVYFGNGFIRYLGAPLGEEVRAFIETVIRLSTGKTGLRQKTRAELSTLAQSASKRVYILTVVTPSCPYCPYAVLLANMFAYESKGKVVSVVVEAHENPDIADMYGVTGVPAVILQAEDVSVGDVEFVGVPPEHELLARVKNHMGLS